MKKALLLLMVVVMLVGLVGCGNKGTTLNPRGTTSNSNSNIEYYTSSYGEMWVPKCPYCGFVPARGNGRAVSAYTGQTLQQICGSCYSSFSTTVK